MPALGTRGQFGARLLGVEMVATDTVKGDLAPSGFVQGLVATVVKGPKDPEQAQHQQAIKDDLESEVGRCGHRADFTQTRP